MLRMKCKRVLVIFLIVSSFLILIEFNKSADSRIDKNSESYFPIQKYSNDKEFIAFISNQLADLQFRNLFNYKDAVSVVAIPLHNLIDIEEVEKGVIIGAVYFSTGSIKYKVGPGNYVIKVRRAREGYEAHLLDNRKRVRSSVPAEIFRPGFNVTKAMVSLDMSICYHLNGGVVCI